MKIKARASKTAEPSVFRSWMKTLTMTVRCLEYRKSLMMRSARKNRNPLGKRLSVGRMESKFIIAVNVNGYFKNSVHLPRLPRAMSKVIQFKR